MRFGSFYPYAAMSSDRRSRAVYGRLAEAECADVFGVEAADEHPHISF